MQAFLFCFIGSFIAMDDLYIHDNLTFSHTKHEIREIGSLIELLYKFVFDFRVDRSIMTSAFCHPCCICQSIMSLLPLLRL